MMAMSFQDLKYYEITRKIIGAAVNVHTHLGPGFQESIYQRALAIEMQNIGLRFNMEFVQNIVYKN